MRTMFVLALVALGACSSPSVDPSALAVVNGKAISPDTFGAYAVRVVPPGKVLDEETKTKVLNQLVDDEVLLQEALAQAVYEDPMVRRTLITQLLRTSVYAEAARIDVPEEQARAFFEEHKEEFVVPEKVQVRRLLLRPGQGEDDDAVHQTVEGLRAQIQKQPELFRSLAREHSQGPFAQRGGDLGYVGHSGKDGIPDAVISQAFELDLGELSPAFAADEGWNLVQVVNRRDRIERSFDQMRASVERRIRTDRQEELKQDFIESLRSKSEVRINQGNLSSYQLKRNPSALPGVGSAMPIKIAPVRRPEVPSESR